MLAVLLNNEGPVAVGFGGFPNKLDPVLVGFTVVDPKSPPLPVVPVVFVFVDPNNVLPVFAGLLVVVLPKSEGCVG